MNDLSDSSDPQDAASSGAPLGVAPSAPSGNKEAVGGSDRPEGLQDATGQEIELPKEVVSAGVRIHPTSVSIPPAAAQMGLKPAGNNVPVQTTSTVILPLSDEQIATGLRQSIANSWRWLAQWCVKQLKQLHIVLRSAGGKNIRVKI